MVKKILSIIAWVITGAALIVLFVFAHKGFTNAPLQGVVFNLERQGDKGFVEKDTVIANIEDLCGIRNHASIGSVDLMKIQKLLSNSPWIESSSAFIGLNDTLMISAKEYIPIVRIFNKKGQSVYVTRDGAILPSSKIYTPRLIIANGNFEFPTSDSSAQLSDTSYAESGISETLAITKAVLADDFLRGSIGQIYRNERKQYEIMVNSLPARVIVGDTVNIKQKMSRLHTLLEKHSGTDELLGYKTLDLRYNNQIVCTKK